jgi:cell division protease FtsH
MEKIFSKKITLILQYISILTILATLIIFNTNNYNIYYSIILFILLIIITFFALNIDNKIQEKSYTDLFNNIKNRNIKKAFIYDNTIIWSTLDDNEFKTTIKNSETISNILLENNIDLSFKNSSNSLEILKNVIFISLIIIIYALIYYRLNLYNDINNIKVINSKSNTGNSLARSKARLFMPLEIKENFKSVAGAEEAKEELEDIVDYLINPEKYKKIGAKLPRGVLLVGEPGNGKTLLAKALAGEAKCPFFSTNGADFIEIFAGLGSARVKDLFMQARQNSPCIIFIDEIDAIGKKRILSNSGSGEEREHTLNQLLSEMDGFDSSSYPIVVIGATNRPEILDKALLRPGRFDRKVYVPYPNLENRKDILTVHTKGVKINPNVDLYKIAKGTPGFTGADLANLINEAAIIASKNNQNEINIYDIEEARDKIMIGKEIKSIKSNDKEIRITAFHEAGHALINLLLPEYLDPLHKVTIIPRGSALGVTHSLAQTEKHLISKEEMLATICKALGGRAAEELVFQSITTGASNDLEYATKIAKDLVIKYGMSNLGPISSTDKNLSQDTISKIDNEIKNILNESYDRTKKMLSDNIDKLYKLAETLIKNKTLFARDIYQLLDIKQSCNQLD